MSLDLDIFQLFSWQKKRSSDDFDVVMVGFLGLIFWGGEWGHGVFGEESFQFF